MDYCHRQIACLIARYIYWNMLIDKIIKCMQTIIIEKQCLDRILITGEQYSRTGSHITKDQCFRTRSHVSVEPCSRIGSHHHWIVMPWDEILLLAKSIATWQGTGEQCSWTESHYYSSAMPWDGIQPLLKSNAWKQYASDVFICYLIAERNVMTKT